MSTQVQYRRGTQAENDAFTGALAEITVDTTNWTIRVHDGTTAGGHAVPTLDATQTFTNKTYASPIFTGTVTGNFIPITNNTYTLGNATNSWKSLYVAGNTIFLGSLQLKDIGSNTFAIYTSDGTTQANVDVGNIDVSAITSGTSTIGISGINGNGYVTVGGTSNVLVVATTGTYTTGLASVTGNVVGGNFTTGGVVSAAGNVTGNYLLGNAYFVTGLSPTKIYNGTSEINISTSGGNANVSIGGTSNVLVAATTGVYVTGLISATGDINTSANLNATSAFVNAGAVITSGRMEAGTSISATGNITGGNLLTGGLVSASGNITGGNLIAATLVQGTTVSASGNVTGGNVTTAGLMSAAGNIISANVNASTLRPAAGALTISTVSGNLNLQPTTGNIVVNSTYINGVTDPVQNQDVATKAYVDNLVSTGIAYHPAVTAATVTTLAVATGGTVTYSQPNGAGNGIGALLTTTGAFNLIDTANIQTVGTRVLVKDEANAVFNGVYTWANATNLVRATDADEYGTDSANALSVNDYFFVQSGNVNAGSAYVVSSPSGTITFGTSNITFSQFSTSQVYSGNTQAGISINGTVINAKVDNTTTAFDGSGNISVKASAQLTTPNIGAATGTSVSVTGNVNGGNVVATTLVQGTTVSASGNVIGGNVTTGGIISATGNITGGNLSVTNIAGTLTTAAQTNITSVGTLASLTVTANVTGGNILTGGQISATGNLTAGNVSATNLSGTLTTASQTNITSVGTLGSLTVTANVAAGNLTTGGQVSATGNITGGNVSVASGTVTLGNIVNNNANGVGNIGSSTVYFNTVFGKATTAQYADLAEMYAADAAYAPGTVLEFGGANEVTVATANSTRVAGVVSTNPAHLMNSVLSGEHSVPVALTGRVPTSVIGTVSKGDMMVAGTNGVAVACASPAIGTVLGKALEDYNSDKPGLIEVVVGRL